MKMKESAFTQDKVLAKNYNEAIQLLKDKGLLYET